ncbi:MAG: helix-turn-helix domain-containing protein [Nocardioidaceae bacterium]
MDRALKLLGAWPQQAPRGETVAELAAQCGINRATAWRLLGTLEAHRLVERDPSTNRYQIGFALIRMSAAAGHDGLVRRTRPILERVSGQTGETADLAVTGPTRCDLCG